MVTRFTPQFAHRRVATSVAAVLGAAALTGSSMPTGVADAATPHIGAGANRVLQVDVHITGFAQHRVESEYFGAHDRYLLISQYGKQGKLDFRSWQKDAVGGRERAVERVRILPDRKRYTVQTGGIAPLPAVSFGVLSTRDQVAQAIRNGTAHEEGLGMKDGQRVRLLRLTTGTRVRNAMLWVNPSTLAPVASSVAYVTNGHSTRVVSAHWTSTDATAVRALTAAPKTPAGYQTNRS